MAVLLLLAGWYGFATLPYLGDFPLIEWAQMGIAAPAHKLATEGVYGNDLFTGFFRNEAVNYEYMPLYPLLVALSFESFGLGVVQARSVSVLAGLAVLGLTFLLGRQLYGRTVGLLAAGLLGFLRLGVGTAPYHSGIHLVDIGRMIRYDVLVPVWVLAACCVFVWSFRTNVRLGYLGAGVLVGLATLSHLYGAFALAVFAALLLWQQGMVAFRTAPLYLLVGGWMLALSPWALYVLQDPVAYQGQMLRHADRFELFDPRFYARNLIREVYRYGPWVGPSLRTPVLWPRLGIWIAAVGVPAALALLWSRARRHGRLPDRLLLLALPVLSILLALLIGPKRHAYLALTIPFMALALAVLAERLWQGSKRHASGVRAGLTALAILVVLEGVTGVAQARAEARAATPYDRIAEALRATIPPDARVLMSQTYWMALAEYETRSINLVLVLSDPRYGVQPPRTMAEAIRHVAPDYVVVERYFMEDYGRDPRTLPHFRAQWRAFADYVRQACPRRVLTIDTADYGEIRVHQCD